MLRVTSASSHPPLPRPQYQMCLSPPQLELFHKIPPFTLPCPWEVASLGNGWGKGKNPLSPMPWANPESPLLGCPACSPVQQSDDRQPRHDRSQGLVWGKPRVALAFGKGEDVSCSKKSKDSPILCVSDELLTL